MRTFLLWTVVVAVLLLGLGSLQKFEALPQEEPGSLFVKIADPLSGDNPVYRLLPLPVPKVGETLVDSRLLTKLMRITQQTGLRHEYARFDPFNQDQSMILLHHSPTGQFRVYRSPRPPYDERANLVRTLEDLSELRWDPVVPHLLWGFKDFQITNLDCRTGQFTVSKDFSADATIKPILQAEPDLYRITTKDEGESSQDKRFWALLLQGSKADYRVRYLFTWDRTTDRILGVYKIPKDVEIDWVGMSPLGHWVVIGADAGSGRLSGLTMADKELKRFRQLSVSTAHSDVALDCEGNEVIVMQNTQTDYLDLIPLSWETQAVPDSGEYAGSRHARLARLFYDSNSKLGLQSGIHISCNVPGYCVVSTYIEPDRPEQNWLDRSIILVKLDARHPQAWYLAKVHNTTGAYWEETHATITNDGARVVWASNWGRTVGKGEVFLMQLDMPRDWRTTLK